VAGIITIYAQGGPQNTRQVPPCAIDPKQRSSSPNCQLQLQLQLHLNPNPSTNLRQVAKFKSVFEEAVAKDKDPYKLPGKPSGRPSL